MLLGVVGPAGGISMQVSVILVIKPVWVLSGHSDIFIEGRGVVKNFGKVLDIVLIYFLIGMPFTIFGRNKGQKLIGEAP